LPAEKCLKCDELPHTTDLDANSSVELDDREDKNGDPESRQRDDSAGNL